MVSGAELGVGVPEDDMRRDAERDAQMQRLSAVSLRPPDGESAVRSIYRRLAGEKLRRQIGLYVDAPVSRLGR